MRRTVLWSALLLSCFWCGVATAENKIKLTPVSADGKGDLPSGSLYIFNRASKLLQFDLSEDRSDWRGFALESGRGGTASTGRSSVASLGLRLRTGQQTIVRSLSWEHRYQLYWNSGRKRWDVAEIGTQ